MKRILILLILTLLFTVGCSGALSKNFNDLSTSQKEKYVYSMAEELIKDKLKSPTSAKFSAWQVDSMKENKYIIRGSVDSQNGFGAMIRSKFQIGIQVDTQYNESIKNYKYKVVYVNID